MMPGMDPRALKSMMAQMGIKTSEIDAVRVVIECEDKNIVINSPSVTKIDARGAESFQITGEISEQQKITHVEITDDDIKIVSDQTGIADTEKIKEALSASNGDIAAAILALKEES